MLLNLALKVRSCVDMELRKNNGSVSVSHCTDTMAVSQLVTALALIGRSGGKSSEALLAEGQALLTCTRRTGPPAGLRWAHEVAAMQQQRRSCRHRRRRTGPFCAAPMLGWW